MSSIFKYSHIDETHESDDDTETKVILSSRSRPLYVLIIYAIILGIVTSSAGFWLGRASVFTIQDLHSTQAANGIFSNAYALRKLPFNETFGLPPSPELDEAWSSLFPSMLMKPESPSSISNNFAEGPEGIPSGGSKGTSIAVFHQLHCLVSLLHESYVLTELWFRFVGYTSSCLLWCQTQLKHHNTNEASFQRSRATHSPLHRVHAPDNYVRSRQLTRVWRWQLENHFGVRFFTCMSGLWWTHEMDREHTGSLKKTRLYVGFDVSFD